MKGRQTRNKGVVVTDLKARVKELESMRCLTWDDTLKLLILELTPFTVWACDKDFAIVLWNKRCEEVYGYSRDEAIGRSFIDLFVDEPEQDEAMKDCVEIIDNAKIFRNFIAYDNSRQEKRRVMLTNCFRIRDERNNRWLQAEVGLQIDDLDLAWDNHQSLREVGIARRKDAELKVDYKRKELEARVKAALRQKEYVLLQSKFDCERWERDMREGGVRPDDNKVAQLKLNLGKVELSIREGCHQLERAIHAATAGGGLEDIEVEVRQFEGRKVEDELVTLPKT